MNTLFLGLIIGVAYGLIGSLVVSWLGNIGEVPNFLVAYTTSFKTMFSLGLVVGTALIVFRTQEIIPNTIEAAFSEPILANTKYFKYKKRFSSVRRSVTFSADFTIVGFALFSYCGFPLSKPSEIIMVIAGCIQYGLAVYIGRKIFYAGMMLHSLLPAPVSRNLFRERELDEVNSYVHITSTLTIIFIYIHVIGYFNGPFLYQSFLGNSIKPILLLPAIIATPVLLIFTFYPRSVLRKIYSKSIDCEIKSLQEVLRSEELTAFEKRSYLIEFNKMSRDELRYSLQLTLTDLPIGITILIMLLQPLIGRY